MRNIENVLSQVRPNIGNSSAEELPAPHYSDLLAPLRDTNFALAVGSMRNHTTDEGWQIMESLACGGGYRLFGSGLSHDTTDLKEIVRLRPRTLVIQDKREYEGLTAGGVRGFDMREKFANVGHLVDQSDIFKLTILKDAHARIDYHRDAAIEAGIHAWIIYYHPKVVKHLAPYVRERHLIRTYHTVNSASIPKFNDRRRGAILSGAVSSAYPLRTRLFANYRQMPDVDLLDHPGYRRDKCFTPEYLELLNKYKVAICTSSIYGYALRKIIEATACGCLVITDLPHDEVLPEIDKNLIRIDPTVTTMEMSSILRDAYRSWDEDKQLAMANRAIEFYDFRVMGQKLANDIELLRRCYPAGVNHV